MKSFFAVLFLNVIYISSIEAQTFKELNHSLLDKYEHLGKTMYNESTYKGDHSGIYPVFKNFQYQLRGKNIILNKMDYKVDKSQETYARGSTDVTEFHTHTVKEEIVIPSGTYGICVGYDYGLLIDFGDGVVLRFMATSDPTKSNWDDNVETMWICNDQKVVIDGVKYSYPEPSGWNKKQQWNRNPPRLYIDVRGLRTKETKRTYTEEKKSKSVSGKKIGQ